MLPLDGQTGSFPPLTIEAWRGLISVREKVVIDRLRCEHRTERGIKSGT